MGTRSLTVVIDQVGEKKVAQYGQWDGYPSGVGVDILDFINNKEKFNLLKSKLALVRFLDDEGVDKEFIESYNKNTPQWSGETDRDLAEKEIVLSYIINLKDETLGIYSHIDQPPIKVYSLNELPSNEQFVKELEGSDED